MATSDRIARFILDMLEETDGMAELQRSVLADRFGCVPSQINYVISTRFSPEHGYVVESRRGGGYIRITRVRSTPQELIMHTVNAVGDSLDAATARAFISNVLSAGVIDRQTARLLLAATGESALRPVMPEDRDTVRASIFKHMLVTTVTE